MADATLCCICGKNPALPFNFVLRGSVCIGECCAGCRPKNWQRPEDADNDPDQMLNDGDQKP